MGKRKEWKEKLASVSTEGATPFKKDSEDDSWAGAWIFFLSFIFLAIITLNVRHFTEIQIKELTAELRGRVVAIENKLDKKELKAIGRGVKIIIEDDDWWGEEDDYYD